MYVAISYVSSNVSASILNYHSAMNCNATVQLQGFTESLQHCIKPQISLTSLYGSFSALNLPYNEVT